MYLLTLFRSETLVLERNVILLLDLLFATTLLDTVANAGQNTDASDACADPPEIDTISEGNGDSFGNGISNTQDEGTLNLV